MPVCLFATDKRHMILGKMYGWLEFKNFDFLNQRKNTITEQQVKDECEAPWKPIIIKLYIIKHVNYDSNN